MFFGFCFGGWKMVLGVGGNEKNERDISLEEEPAGGAVHPLGN